MRPPAGGLVDPLLIPLQLQAPRGPITLFVLSIRTLHGTNTSRSCGGTEEAHQRLEQTAVPVQVVRRMEHHPLRLQWQLAMRERGLRQKRAPRLGKS